MSARELEENRQKSILLYKRWIAAIPAIKALYDDKIINDQGVRQFLAAVNLTVNEKVPTDKILSESYWRERIEATSITPAKKKAEDDGVTYPEE